MEKIKEPHGVFGFRHPDNFEKLAISFHDPSPSSLGLEFVKVLHAGLYLGHNSVQELRKIAINMSYGDHSKKESISKNNAHLLRFLLVPEVIADKIWFLQGNNSVRDSMWCEWAYIFNFDGNILEIYRGGNKDPKATGCYSGSRMSNGYCGVRLVAKIGFDKIMNCSIQAVKNWMCDVTYKTGKGKDLLGVGGQKKKVDKKYLGEEIMVF